MRPVVLLHGFLGASEDWEPSRAALEADGRDVFVPDLPGHGATPLEVAPTTIDGWAAWLDRTAPPGRVDAVGYSLGGRLLMAWAARCPERFGRVVFVSASPGIGDPAARAARAALDDERAAALEADLPGWLDRWYRQPLFRPLDEDDAARAAEVARRARNDASSMARVVSGLSPGRAPDRAAFLSSWSQPTRWIVGALDDAYVDRTARLVEALPQATMHVIEGAGHAVPRTHAAALAAELRRLLGAPFVE